ncbi:MAG: YciI family protein [Micrococcus sp.]|nr:YciI family protein [Micrococcus sp.]
MSQYLISVWHAPGVHAAGTAYDSEDDMRRAFERVNEFNTHLQDTGAFVGAGGLTPPEEAVVVDATDAAHLEEATAAERVIEGTMSSGDMLLGGFWIVEAADEAAARALAGRASYACGQPVELRALQG